MKEFEKWSKTPTGYAERASAYAEGEAAWRAALELVFGWLDYSAEHEEIKDKICKELEE